MINTESSNNSHWLNNFELYVQYILHVPIFFFTFSKLFVFMLISQLIRPYFPIFRANNKGGTKTEESIKDPCRRYMATFHERCSVYETDDVINHWPTSVQSCHTLHVKRQWCMARQGKRRVPQKSRVFHVTRVIQKNYN